MARLFTIATCLLAGLVLMNIAAHYHPARLAAELIGGIGCKADGWGDDTCAREAE